ncbi:MAG: ABC transporter ATP-binding protein [Promethearchaeota archaeon]
MKINLKNKNEAKIDSFSRKIEKGKVKVHPMEKDVVLEVRNLEKTYITGKYKVPALRNLNLHVKHGELVSIVGPSGSGKSTLINCLGALDYPDSGNIIYNINGDGKGYDITEMDHQELKEMRLNRIGLIFQFYNLFPVLTAYENVEFPMLLKKIPPSERDKRVKELLKMVGLDKRMHHYPTQMSGGEQQRVTVARALANDPLLIICDEPTGELDTETTTQIMEIFLDLTRKGHSILMVTHNLRIAEASDRILTLKDGQIINERKGGKPLDKIFELNREEMNGEA